MSAVVFAGPGFQIGVAENNLPTVLAGMRNEDSRSEVVLKLESREPGADVNLRTPVMDTLTEAIADIERGQMEEP